jgi:hypothetical protein
MRRWLVVLVPLLAACGEPQSAHDADVRCRASHTAKTAGEGVKTGGTTAWEGIKTAGKTIGGFVGGGSDGARQEWKQGKKHTGATARAGAKDTKAAAKDNPCK